MEKFITAIGYLDQLKNRRETAQAQKAAAPKPPTLHQRVEAWHNGLSDEDKSRAWTMKEFREIFGETPQRLGTTLFQLGWTRRRSWADSRPTSRFWVKE